MIKFMLPGFYEHFDLNYKFINLMREHPEWFNDNTEVYAVYGNFQFCIFDGGRVFDNYQQASIEDVEQIAFKFNEINIPIRLTFTNPIIEEKDLYDIFSNKVLEICENNLNEIVLNSSILEEYIKKNYPKYKIISSTTKCLNSNSFLEELNKNYHMICLDYNLNKNKKFLSDLTLDQIKKTELLVNPICGAGCPNRKDHYRLNGLFSLNYGKNYQMEQCYIKKNIFDPSHLNDCVNISPEEIFNIYAPMGFQYYKLEGRSWKDIHLSLMYVYYMVKPEFKNYVLSIILNK